MKTVIVIEISLPIKCLASYGPSWYYHFGCVKPDMPKVPKIGSLHIFAIPLGKHGRWCVSLLLADKCKTFLQDPISLALSIQNNKFVISLQYLKENGKNEVGFLFAEKLEFWLQINIKDFFKLVLSF